MNPFTRTISLLGEEAFARIQETRIILFGVGGVGGWCAETLVRTGIQNLTIVDYDVVDETNLNRQIVALATNIGKPKVYEMQQRLFAINPNATITAIHKPYNADTAADFSLADFDYVIDAIDSVKDKALLIHNATQVSKFYSSMGAGRKTSAESIEVTEFWKVAGCPLARSLRHYMKRNNLYPAAKFQCVYSPQLLDQIGTIAPIVGIFGMTLANQIIQDICKNTSY